MTPVRNPAPIALFAYNRPHHLRGTVEALAKNSLAAYSELHVFLDGAKSDADRDAVAAVRQYISEIEGFKSISVTAQEKNQGLAASIVGGVSLLLDSHERVIVLEDDIITSPFFLEFMNDALEAYKSDLEVASIHGFMYAAEGLPETFFLRGADCWGWATWRRAWQVFNPDGAELLRQLEGYKLLDEFDLGGAVPNVQMLRDQIDGRNDSWAIRWHASAFLQNKLTLHPGHSLIQNIGLDGSGTHCQNVPDHLKVEIATRLLRIERLPLAENIVARKQIAKFLLSQAICRPLESGVVAKTFQAIRAALGSKQS